MSFELILGILAVVIAISSGLGLIYYLVSPREQANMRSLMSGSVSVTGWGQSATQRKDLKETKEDELIKKLKSKTAKKKKVSVSLEEKLFRAGLLSANEKKEFHRLRFIIPLITIPLGAYLGSMVGGAMTLVGLIMGFLLGLQAPMSILDRKIAARSEDIMFYLPLVIEQIAIGVSSSLDIGPCLQRVVAMADERDTHNVVTELLRHAQYHIKSGVSMEEAMTEVGKLSGHTELKHAFMSLSQVAKHGGEISRQLQELADAVAAQRETRIEGKIKKLELEATGPVALVFAAFLVTLLMGFGLQVMKGFA